MQAPTQRSHPSLPWGNLSRQTLSSRKINSGSCRVWENPREGFGDCRRRRMAALAVPRGGFGLRDPQHPPSPSPRSREQHPEPRAPQRGAGPTPHTRMGLKHGRLIKSPFKRTTIHTTTRGAGRRAAAHGGGSGARGKEPSSHGLRHRPRRGRSHSTAHQHRALPPLPALPARVKAPARARVQPGARRRLGAAGHPRP